MNVRDNAETLAAPASAAPGGGPPPGAAGTGPEGILTFVAAASQCMVQHVDLKTGLQATVARLGELSGHDRAFVLELSADRLTSERVADWQSPGQVHAREVIGPDRFAVADDQEAWRSLLAGSVHLWSRPESNTNETANSTPHQAFSGSVGMVVPIIVDETCWGCIGLGASRDERRHGEAQMQGMRAVASIVAAAIQRSRAEALARNEALRLRRLLAAVNEASAHLLAHADLETALARAAESLRVHTEVDRVFIGRYVEEEQSTCFWLESRRPDIPPMTHGFGPGPWPDDEFSGVAYPLREGRTYCSISAQRNGVNAAANAANGSRSDLIMPIMVGGRYCGCIGFDDNTQARTWSDAEAGVLRTAATCIGAAMSRQQTDAERRKADTARLLAEQRRSSELARSNAALRQSLDALAGTDGEGGFLRDALLQLQVQTGALSAYLFRTRDTDTRLGLVGRATAGVFSMQPAEDDPGLFHRDFEMDPKLFALLKERGGMLWRKVDPDTPITPETPESIVWHVRMGHKANAVHALMVGERQVGFIGMVFDTSEPLSEAALDHAHALCQPITLALELTRLSRLAQRGREQTAVLKERNRLAREIHDGIAQSFLAIQMQLDAFERDVGAAGPVQKALELSRHGLAEARRAVAALRPQGLQGSDLPEGIERLLAQFLEGGTIDWRVVKPARWEPLPGQAEDHLYRIVQEALNNARLHARARDIRVELSQAAGETTVLIADDGIGFDRTAAGANRGFGMESMQQRAQLIGARIDWLSQPGKGTQVLLSWTPTQTSTDNRQG